MHKELHVSHMSQPPKPVTIPLSSKKKQKTKNKKNKKNKNYACAFFSTTDFLNAFSRMVATRGRPEEVPSDNGTNFVGAERELRELVQAKDQEQIAGNVANNEIRWNWNPPLESHFGGVFESLRIF